MKALFDTCILVDYLKGIPAAEKELARFDDKAISVITWMEVMVGTNEVTERKTDYWLTHAFEVIDVDKAISVQAVTVRKNRKVKLPDAVIFATAQCTNRLFVTRNTKDFSPDEVVIRIPYQIG